jgi:hypothetical protein
MLQPHRVGTRRYKFHEYTKISVQNKCRYNHFNDFILCDGNVYICWTSKNSNLTHKLPLSFFPIQVSWRDSTKRSVLREILHALHAKVKTTRNFATSVSSRTVIATQSFDGNRQGRNWMQLQRQLQ